MATELYNSFGDDIESLNLIWGDKGAFEVSVNGEMVFSKRQAGRFPETRELKALLQERLQSKVAAT